jgi:hypothetical protein
MLFPSSAIIRIVIPSLEACDGIMKWNSKWQLCCSKGTAGCGEAQPKRADERTVDSGHSVLLKGAVLFPAINYDIREQHASAESTPFKSDPDHSFPSFLSNQWGPVERADRTGSFSSHQLRVPEL